LVHSSREPERDADAIKSKQFVEDQIHFIVYAVDPTVTATICLFAITGNGMILSALITHKEKRALSICILMNLTAVDSVTLLKILLQHNF
jgi:hypothetical protein